MFALGEGLAVFHQLVHERDNGQRLFFHGDVGGFQPRQGEELADQIVHASQFAFQPCNVFRQLFGAGLHQPDNRLHAGQRRAHFVGNVVQQVAFFGNELLELRRHFVKLDAEVGEFVFAVVQLLRHARVQLARCEAVHAVFQNAYRLGDVAGQNIGEQQPDGEYAAEYNKFVPHGGNGQAGNHKGGQPLHAGLVKIADEEEVFFAVWVVIQDGVVGGGVFEGEFVGLVYFGGGDFAVEDVGAGAAGDDVDILCGGHLPVLQKLAGGGGTLCLESDERVGKQRGLHVARLLEVGFGQAVLYHPKSKAGDEDAADDDHAEGGEDALEKFHRMGGAEKMAAL